MRGPYDDILHLPYTGSKRPKRISMTDRGAQFSPFAALTGYDAAIQETGRLTDRQVELDADARAALDERLRWLILRMEEKPVVTVTFFVPDAWKDGGAYETVTDTVQKIDSHRQLLLLAGGRSVSFDRIRDIQGDIFQQIEGLYFLEETVTIEEKGPAMPDETTGRTI